MERSCSKSMENHMERVLDIYEKMDHTTSIEIDTNKEDGRMKKIAAIIFFVFSVCVLGACGSSAGSQNPASQAVGTETGRKGTTAETEQEEDREEEQDQETKILVAYFSCTNTTRPLAEYAADALGADLYEIVPAVPYTAEDLNYSDSDCRADKEQKDPASRPEISGSVEGMEEYDLVFVGYPIWWGQAPKIIYTFMESYDFSGKTIVPFCTSGSSGIGSSATNLHDLCADTATWLDGARLEGSTTREEMAEWINGLGLDVTAE